MKKHVLGFLLLSAVSGVAGAVDHSSTAPVATWNLTSVKDSVASLSINATTPNVIVAWDNTSNSFSSTTLPFTVSSSGLATATAFQMAARVLGTPVLQQSGGLHTVRTNVSVGTATLNASFQNVTLPGVTFGVGTAAVANASSQLGLAFDNPMNGAATLANQAALNDGTYNGTVQVEFRGTWTRP